MKKIVAGAMLLALAATACGTAAAETIDVAASDVPSEAVIGRDEEQRFQHLDREPSAPAEAETETADDATVATPSAPSAPAPSAPAPSAPAPSAPAPSGSTPSGSTPSGSTPSGSTPAAPPAPSAPAAPSTPPAPPAPSPAPPAPQLTTKDVSLDIYFYWYAHQPGVTEGHKSLELCTAGRSLSTARINSVNWWGPHSQGVVHGTVTFLGGYVNTTSSGLRAVGTANWDRADIWQSAYATAYVNVTYACA